MFWKSINFKQFQLQKSNQRRELVPFQSFEKKNTNIHRKPLVLQKPAEHYSSSVEQKHKTTASVNNKGWKISTQIKTCNLALHQNKSNHRHSARRCEFVRVKVTVNGVGGKKRWLWSSALYFAGPERKKVKQMLLGIKRASESLFSLHRHQEVLMSFGGKSMILAKCCWPFEDLWTVRVPHNIPAHSPFEANGGPGMAFLQRHKSPQRCWVGRNLKVANLLHSIPGVVSSDLCGPPVRWLLKLLEVCTGIQFRTEKRGVKQVFGLLGQTYLLYKQRGSKVDGRQALICC